MHVHLLKPVISGSPFAALVQQVLKYVSLNYYFLLTAEIGHTPCWKLYNKVKLQ